MSMVALRWVRPIKVTPPQKAILWALADQANDEGEAWPSTASLAEATCLSERAVQGAVIALREIGLLAITPGGGRHRTSTYRLTLETPQDVRGKAQVVRGKKRAETPQVVRNTPQDVRNTPQVVRETPQDVHPNPKEPSGTLMEPPRARAMPATAEVILPVWLPDREWSDWCAYRKGKTWTQRAAELSIAKLDEFRQAGSDPAEVINQSIANGWRGLFPVKQASGRKSSSDWVFNDPMFSSTGTRQ